MKLAKRAALAAWIGFTSLTVLDGETRAMAGLLGSNTLFSAVTGKVTMGGQPVSGAEIVQSVSFSGNNPIKRTVRSAADGSFSLDAITKGKGLRSLLPQEFVANQNITIRHGGTDYIAWVNSKRSPDAGAETGSNPIRLVCDLEAKADHQDTHYGICRLE